jgi:tripartite-type tricarboxylate transporter receptor subunit TctC
MDRRLFVRNSLAVASISMIQVNVLFAQERWQPKKPIKFIVPAPPGSTPDATARPLAEKLAEDLGQAVVVENRPGAGGVIGMESVVRSSPDGYTIGLATQSQMVFNPFLFEKLPYDATKDVQAITRIASLALVLAAHPNLAVSNLRDLIALAKTRASNPIQIGVPLLGTPPHVISLLIQNELGIKFDVVPFKGTAEAVSACRAGDVSLVLEAPPAIIPHAKDGKLKILAVTGSSREPQIPEIPTINEVAGKFIPGETWFGLIAPAGVPLDIISQYQRSLSTALSKPELKALYANFSWRIIEKSSPQEFNNVIKEESSQWGQIIRRTGIKLG